MANREDRPHHHSITGGLIVVIVGVVILIANLHPDLDLWSVALRYWPVILIIFGLGKIFDAFRIRSSAPAGGPDAAPDTGANLGLGVAVSVIAVCVVIAVLSGHGHVKILETSQSIDLQNAKTVNTTITLPSGNLDLAGGAPRLLDANFKYRERDGKPTATYTVTHDEGILDIAQENSSHVHLASSGNDWRLRFADAVPLELNVDLGAGKANLDLRGLSVDNADLKLGVGSLDLNLTGPRKTDMHVDIHGGIGSATIHLPREVGVRVHASDGIGGVSDSGLHQDHDDYTNDALGKSPATIYVTVEGGIGHITLKQEASSTY
jgi:N-terminal domain of toast_rack, DUF2154/Domain of unknown function (DUF5668)